MPIVTIRGQMGSGASDIGRLVSRKLNADYVDREIIAGVAELLKCGEQAVIAKEMPPGSLLGRVANALRREPQGVADFAADMNQGDLPRLKKPPDDNQYLQGLKSIIQELALSGSIVIRGRGSQFILKHWPGALHVFIVLPLALRVKRVALELNVDAGSAKKEIARFDESRRQFIKRYFKAELEDSAHYDLVISTQHLHFEAAASIIVNAIPLKSRN